MISLFKKWKETNEQKNLEFEKKLAKKIVSLIMSEFSKTDSCFMLKTAQSESLVIDFGSSSVDLASQIGAQIKKYRLERNMTQEQLAEKAHTSHTQVSRHESGRNLTVEILQSYADALGVSPKDLIPSADSKSKTKYHENFDKIISCIAERMPELHTLSAEQCNRVCQIVKNTLDLILDSNSKSFFD